MSRNFIPDETLIDQLLLDDTSAFEELHHRYCYYLYSYCINKLDSPEDARRIVRDIFIVLWQKRHTLRVDFSLSLYLYTEVRKAVVQCVHEKLETNKDLSVIQTQIIPGFAVINLQKARQPVKKRYSEIRYFNLLANNKVITKTPWWNHNPSGISIQVIKQALQRAFNLL